MFSSNSILKILSLSAVLIFSQFTLSANIDMNADANDVTLHNRNLGT
jgi:hypothetical protein